MTKQNVVERFIEPRDVLKEAKNVMIEHKRRILRKRRSTKHTVMVPRAVAILSSYVLNFIKHYKKKGVTVGTRLPAKGNQVIVQLKKIRLKREKNTRVGQGRMEQVSTDTLLLPKPLAKMINFLFITIFNYNTKVWKVDTKRPVQIDELLKELIELRRKSHSTRTQG